MQHFIDHVLDVFGAPIENASIQVNLTGGAAATIYSDNSLTAKTNPLTTDALGQFDFYAADGRYDLVISGTGFATRTVADILLEDQVEGTDVQAWSARLDDLAGLAVTDGNMAVGDGTNWVAENGATLRSSIGVGTGNSPQFTGIELGHATDTTLTRPSAGNMSIEGNIVYRAGGTDVPVTDGGTGASDAPTARTNLGVVPGTDVLAQQTIGIADDNLLEVDDAGPPAAGEYARFTANGLEGRIEAEFKADFNLEIGTDVQAYDVDTTKNDVANTFTADQTIKSTDAGATVGPLLNLYRDSASAAVSDLLGAVVFEGNDDAGTPNKVSYARVMPFVRDPSEGSVDAALVLQAMVAGTLTSIATFGPGVQVGTPTGGDKGAGTINAAADIYKNNSAYTNPDYVFEYVYKGKVDKYKDSPGAKEYKGLLPLNELEAYTKEHLRLPNISDKPMGAFERSDKALEKIEELTLYIIELNKKIEKLEARE